MCVFFFFHENETIHYTLMIFFVCETRKCKESKFLVMQQCYCLIINDAHLFIIFSITSVCVSLCVCAVAFAHAQ